MELKKIFSLLEKIETKYPVDKWTIDDIYIWPYIRFLLSFDLFGKDTKYSKMSFLHRNFSKYILGFLKYAYSYLIDIENNDRVHKAKNFFLDNGNQISKIGKKYISTRTDSLILEDQDSIKFVFGYKYFVPRYIKGIFIQFQLDIISLLNVFRKRNNHKVSFDKYDEFLTDLRSEGVDSSKLQLKKIIKGYQSINLFREYFKKLLLKVSPSKAYSNCYDSTYSFGFQLACNDLKIESIDIQHGVQGDMHFGYAGFTKVPKSGYQIFPNTFLVWSEVEKKTIDKWAQKTDKHRAVIKGNSWANLWIKGEQSFVSESINEVKRLIPKNSKVILYALGAFKPDEKIIEAINSSPSEYFWIIRPHPTRLDHAKYVQDSIVECKSKYFIDFKCTLPLFSVLKNIDIHVSERSTVAIESSYFNIHSILTDPSSQSIYSNEFENGYIHIAKTSKEILEFIKNIK